MSDATLAVEVQDASGGARMPPFEKIRDWAKLALGADARGELTIRIVSKRESAELNERYRGKRGPTNVLAFLSDAGVETKDTPRNDTPRNDAPRNDAPRNDAPRNDTPPNDAPRNDTPRNDTPRNDAPRNDTPPNDTPPSNTPPNELLPIGDLVICAPVLAREAAEQRKQLDAHWAHIVIHGTLHLKGYDHETAEQAAVMEGRERELLAGLGFADPYAT